MTNLLPRWFALLLFPLLFIPALTADPEDKEIARLIQQLGDDNFDKREEASKRLLEIGEPALDALQQAQTSRDVEVRRRAAEVVAGIKKKFHGEQLRFTGHTGVVESVSILADGKRVLTGGEDKTLRLWDADTGKCLRVFEGHTDRVSGVLSPDGKRVLSGDHSKNVRLWDATTGKVLRSMTGHTDSVTCVCFGPEGQALSGSIDETVRLWDLQTGKKARILNARGSYVFAVAYSDKARLAVSGGKDLSIRLWDLKTGKVVRELTGHSGNALVSVCFSPDGKRVLSSDIDTLRIWDVETGKEQKRFANTKAMCAAFSPNGTRIVTGSYRDRSVRVWDAETGKELRKCEGHTELVTAVAFFPDGKRIVSASCDGTARVWPAPK